VVQIGGDENMLIRLFFKHIVVILVICAALLGFFKSDDLAQWVPSFMVRKEPSTKVGTAGEHIVMAVGAAEAQKVSEPISQRQNSQFDSDLKLVRTSDNREGGVSSQTKPEFAFQRAREVEGTLPKPVVRVATQASSHAEVVADVMPASDESVGKSMRAPDLSRGRGSGQKGTESAHMNKFGDNTQREVETSSRQPLPTTGTADDSKSLPTPLVEWIPPTGEPKEDTEEAAKTPAAQRQTVQKIWVDARNAFWSRDLAVAELKYHALSAKLPDNPDVMGELGNVFYVQGKHKQTVAAYYRAAELLIEKGQSSRVTVILDLLYKLEPEKANTLRAKMARMHDDVEG
jgi:hypothetical protein